MRGLDQVLPPGLIVNAAAYASQVQVSARQ
jgi:hypothetical protein